MSYQRPGEDRFYVWMGSDGLHVMHKTLVENVIITHDAAGIDNAKAMMRGLCDFLVGEGLGVKMRHGKPTFGSQSK